MSFTLKIALGLFVGILAAIAVFNGSAWWGQRRAQAAEERHRQFLNTLAPQEVILLCGKPLRDEVKRYGNYQRLGPERLMVYHGAREPQVKLWFVGRSSKEKPQLWRYAGIRSANESAPSNVAEKWAEQHRNYEGLVTELPCLLLR